MEDRPVSLRLPGTPYKPWEGLMRMNELIQQHEQLRRDFAWLCDWIVDTHLSDLENGAQLDVFKELVKEYSDGLPS
jgi:hypothetical protein